ncbi:MAG: FAD-binding oxidoreductase [Planctomycetota bacterium]
MTITSVQEALRSKMHPGRIVSKRILPGGYLGVFTVQLDSGQVPVFEAGQFVTLGIDTPHGFVARPYSISSCPLDRDTYEFYIILVDGGKLTPTLFAAAIGSEMKVMTQPKGHFTLAEASARTVVMVATGTGISPFVSQIRTLYRLHQVGVPAGYRVILMHGCAYADEFGYRDELRVYAKAQSSDFDFHYLTTASRPEAARGWSEEHGSGRVNELFRHVFDLPIDARRTVSLPRGVDKVHLRELIRAEPAALMVCGNPGMIDSLRQPAMQLGMGGFLVEEYWSA